MEDPQQSFCEVHICNWNGQNCVAWASKVCHKRGVDVSEVDLRGFREKEGTELYKMSRQDFCTLVGDQYGAMFWKELRSCRAEQQHRCSNCKYEDIPALIPWSNNPSPQERASDLSSHSHLASRLRRNSPSPRCYPDHPTSYVNQMSPVSYEAHSKYPEVHSPPMSYEGSSSPVYHERVRSPEGYSSHLYLPPSPESYRGHCHSPQLMDSDHYYRKMSMEDSKVFVSPITRPLPELLPLDDNDDDDNEVPDIPPTRLSHKKHLLESWRTQDRQSRMTLERAQSNQPIHVIYSAHPAFSSCPTHLNYNAHPSHRPHVTQNQDRPHHTRVIHYSHSPRTSHLVHTNARPVIHVNHPDHRILYNPHTHTSDSSSTVYASDEEEEDDSHDEPGRLVIDFGEESMEVVEKETENIPIDVKESSPFPQDNGPFLQENSPFQQESSPFSSENGPVPHLKKIPTKRRRDRGPKSWEFLMRLLASPDTNPSIIRWEDEAEGSFRLVQPQQIADMWGTRSCKEVLTYNNFARALRYHYKTKLLYKISERQLVYGCGRQAIDYYKLLLKSENKDSAASSTG